MVCTENMESNWAEIEKIIGDTLPPCVKSFLNLSACESLTALREINENNIVEIGEFMSNCDRNVLDELDCCHSEQYKKQTKFKFLPGHRAVLLSLPNKIRQNSEKKCEKKCVQSNTEFPVILNELISTAQENALKLKNSSEYSNTIRFFFTYIYLMSGKSAYETLQKNLPIPSTKTIRTY